MRVIKTYGKNFLPPDVASKGVEFIRRRFFEDWKVTRSEVNRDMLVERTNFVLFDNHEIIAWAGLGNDGELANGCVQSNLVGAGIFTRFITEIYTNHKKDILYVLIPVDDFRSAMTCWEASKGCMTITKTIVEKEYSERIIRLVRIDFATGQVYPTKEALRMQLTNLTK